jgi:hypothetical protein
MVFLIWQQKLHKEVPGHYSSESMALQETPWVSESSNPRPLAVNPNRVRSGRPCSGDGGHRRRGPSAGIGSGAYCGLVVLRVVDGDGRNSGIRLEPEVTAEGSTATRVLRRWTWAKILRTRTSESWGTCTYQQLDEFMQDWGSLTETEAAAARKIAGERRESSVVHQRINGWVL